jgi:NAD(P)-dependent dehydrogenase (short-subunit alcohol dehydrogenase family)
MSDLQGVFDAVSAQLRNLPLLATPETCSGRTYIVTGANSGLGFEAAKHLVALDAGKVVLAVRNLRAGSKAKADIEASTGRTGFVEVWHLDLSSYESVKTFAKRATLELDRIDALIENAGIAVEMDNLAEGHPAIFTINVYSTLLLAVLLLPKMKEDAQRLETIPHITIVSSNSAFSAQPLWDLGKDDASPLQKIVEVGQLDMASAYVAQLGRFLVVQG